MYTIQALWTAARYRIGAIFVILNNTSYRILKQRLQHMRGLAEQVDTYVGMELTDPAIDFVGLARSLGVAGRPRQDRARGDRSARQGAQGRWADADRRRARPRLQADVSGAMGQAEDWSETDIRDHRSEWFSQCRERRNHAFRDQCMVALPNHHTVPSEALERAGKIFMGPAADGAGNLATTSISCPSRLMLSGSQVPGACRPTISTSSSDAASPGPRPARSGLRLSAPPLRRRWRPQRG